MEWGVDDVGRVKEEGQRKLVLLVCKTTAVGGGRMERAAAGRKQWL